MNFSISLTRSEIEAAPQYVRDAICWLTGCSSPGCPTACTVADCPQAKNLQDDDKKHVPSDNVGADAKPESKSGPTEEVEAPAAKMPRKKSPKKKSTKKKTDDTPQEPEAPAEPADPPAEAAAAKEQPEPDAEPEVSVGKLRAKVLEAAKGIYESLGHDTLKAILDDLGIAGVKQCPDDKLAEFLQKLSTAIAYVLTELREPDFRTGSRQLTALVNDVFGTDADGLPRVERLVIAKLRGFPRN